MAIHGPGARGARCPGRAHHGAAMRAALTHEAQARHTRSAGSAPRAGARRPRLPRWRRIGRGLRRLNRLTRAALCVWAAIVVIMSLLPPSNGLRADLKFLFGVVLPLLDVALTVVGTRLANPGRAS